jgi:hypothetical protein
MANTRAKAQLTADLPYLDVHGPDGEDFRVRVGKPRFTIGRLGGAFNDLALQPDPQLLVSQVRHCSLERDEDGWWVVDTSSTNKTFVDRGQGPPVEVRRRAPLTHEDAIVILGRLTNAGERLYWRLVFREPKTVIVDGGGRELEPYLEYDWARATLYRVTGQMRQEIRNLSPQEHQLIRSMGQRNRAHGDEPVMCTYQELIDALWPPPSYHTEADITRLVFSLRRKLEPTPQQPRFLQLVPGFGYRLDMRHRRT